MQHTGKPHPVTHSPLSLHRHIKEFQPMRKRKRCRLCDKTEIVSCCFFPPHCEYCRSDVLIYTEIAGEISTSISLQLRSQWRGVDRVASRAERPLMRAQTGGEGTVRGAPSAPGSQRHRETQRTNIPAEKLPKISTHRDHRETLRQHTHTHTPGIHTGRPSDDQER